MNHIHPCKGLGWEEEIPSFGSPKVFSLSILFLKSSKEKSVKRKSTKILTTKASYFGRIYRMGCKIGKWWIEYRQLIDLLDWLPNIRKKLWCWYQSKNRSRWTYTIRIHHCIGYNNIYCRNKFVWVTSNGLINVQCFHRW